MSATALSTTLADRVRSETGENVFLCYQCNKCSAGCPLAEHFDLTPNQVMRAAQLGLEDLALKSSTPWLCIGCETCTTRCPNGIDVARVMDFMAAESRARGIAAPVPAVGLFADIFLKNLRRFGRSYELGLIMEMNLRSGQPLKDLSMGWAMMRKRKIKLLPEMAGDPEEARPEPRKANQIGYYPGCSLHSVAEAYDSTVRAVAKTLDLDLVEPRGWTCCGSSPAHRVAPKLAVELPLTNLALMDRAGMDAVAVPCSACFNRLKVAQQEVKRNPALKTEVEAKIGHTIEREIDVRTLVDVMVEKIGVQTITARTVRPLTGLKVACYYGCLMTRPPQVTGSDQPENPMVLDRLVRALGATPIHWGHKTSCCGASLSVTRTDIALGLSAKIVADARSAGADVIAVACPLCHTNLDDRQPQMALPDTADGSPRTVPVLYFTQLMALAFGLGPKTAALAKNMVDPRPVLTAVRVLDQ
jgi:heterodisulfide reductase subunit B